MQALVEGHMLTSDEEAMLRESLRFREEDRWLHLLYRYATAQASLFHTRLGTLTNFVPRHSVSVHGNSNPLRVDTWREALLLPACAASLWHHQTEAL